MMIRRQWLSYGLASPTDLPGLFYDLHMQVVLVNFSEVSL